MGSRPSFSRWITLAMACTVLAGCHVDSYFDPSKTGRFEYTPTTIPILERIDVIERDGDPWAKATGVTPEDLEPSRLTYRIAAGDVVTVDIFELIAPGQVWTATRRVGATGIYRLPSPIGDVRAAGLTAQEFQDTIYRIVDERVMPNPMVNVVVEEGVGFTYTIYGAVAGTGLYSLRRSDFRLLDALAQAGGVPLGTQRVYVIRRVPLAEDMMQDTGVIETMPSPPDRQPVDIEDLIRQLDQPEGAASQPPAQVEPAAPTPPPAETQPQEEPPIDIEDLIRQLEKEAEPDTLPGALPQETGPPLDIDELEPVRVQPAPPLEEPATRPAPPPSADTPAETYIYIEQTDEWVPVHPDAQPGPDDPRPSEEPSQDRPFLERIIEVPFKRLKQGDGTYNIVVRPNDRIYVQESESGVVYIDGEILRPGVYNLPLNGKLTLSRLVAAAGGPGPLAIPTRVDLTRIVGSNREATIRLNLGAIRQRTEPDIYLRGDDHIIIGTNFWATPLAVFRNGLRITYGFGFLLDRNFGNDVFGAPPTNVQGR